MDCTQASRNALKLLVWLWRGAPLVYSRAMYQHIHVDFEWCTYQEIESSICFELHVEAVLMRIPRLTTSNINKSFGKQTLNII